MMTNKEKFQKLVSNQTTTIVTNNKARIKNRSRLRAAQDIALKVLDRLEELGWKQVHLAKQMGVSAQQVSKVVSGKENLTLETIVKLEAVLNISILNSTYENKQNIQVAEYSTQPVKNARKHLESTKMFSLASYSGKHKYKTATAETNTTFENAS
jgi:plasmid maintenance system antidote protein VapI